MQRGVFVFNLSNINFCYYDFISHFYSSFLSRAKTQRLSS
ncbi:hypothetical protein CZ797_00905 [Pseudoalteromonas sp. JB197]|nr:hypothetical protein CZ797_00905 [Pseudoalteromonas sp. JB197]